MTTLLSTQSLTAFYGDFQALFNVDFSIKSGEAVAIIGANGAGKSTFLKSLVGKSPSGKVKLPLRIPALKPVKPQKSQDWALPWCLKGGDYFNL